MHQIPSTYSPQANTNLQFPEHEHLNCPRCHSDNTKFCYYNNYNLSQPRHYCKNCRRYWTKGGTLRKVPIGGSTRSKTNKRSSTSNKRTAPPPPPQFQFKPMIAGSGNDDFKKTVDTEGIHDHDPSGGIQEDLSIFTSGSNFR